MGYFFKTLYQLAGREKRVMMSVGTGCALFAGTALPINTLMLGHAINVISLAGINGSRYSDMDVTGELDKLTYYQLIIAALSFLAGYGAVTLWAVSAVRLGANVRKSFFLSLMAQSVGWFEVNKIDELVTRFQQDIPRLERGLGDKIPLCLQWMITWLSSYVVAFSRSWKLSLAILFFSPIVFLVNRSITRKVHGMALMNYQSRVASGLAARDVLCKINTVHCFNNIHTECQRYRGYLQWCWRGEARRAVIFGLGSSFPWVVNGLAFVVIFGYGDQLVANEQLSPGNVFPVFMGVLFALAAVQQVVFHLDAITEAHNSIPPVLEVLQLESPINYFSDQGRQPDHGLHGSLHFKNVSFRSPRNFRIKVLSSFDMDVKAGESVAIVGNLSSGLSAIPKLVKRFYDVNKGQILIDGFDMREYNVRWLRHHTGYITKDTIIFPISVADNLRMGYDDVTQEDLEAAARDVELHDFISGLANGYRTVVREEEDEPAKARIIQKPLKRASAGWDKPQVTFTADVRVRASPSRGSSAARPRPSLNFQDPPGYGWRYSVFAKSHSTSRPIRRGTMAGPSASSLLSASSVASFETAKPSARRGTILWTNLEDSSVRAPRAVKYHSSSPSIVSSDKDTLSQGRLGVAAVASGASQHVLSKGCAIYVDTTVALTSSQKMQLAIARALVRRPGVLLMEDIFSLLNPPILLKLLARLVAKKQTTVLLTNSLSKACCMGRVVVMGHSHKIADGGPDLLTSKSPVCHLRQLRYLQDIAERQKILEIFKEWKGRCISKPTNTFDKVVEFAYARHLSDIDTQTGVFITAMKRIMEEYRQAHDVVTRHPMCRVVQLLGWDVLILGLALQLSLVLGLTHTALAFCVGHFIVHWYELKQDVTAEAVILDVSPLMLVYTMLCSAGAFICIRILEHACFAYTSIRLSTHIRALMFEAMLKQDIQYFDQPDHTPILLAHSLTHDTELVHGMVGMRLGSLLESVSCLVAGFTLAVWSDWRTALLLSTFGPLALLGSVLQAEVHVRTETSYDAFMKEASEVFMEAVENISTITNLNMKKLYKGRLDDIIQDGRKRAVRYATMNGVGYAAASIIIFSLTILFFLTFRIDPGSIGKFPHVFMAFSYLVFGLAGVDLTLPRTCLLGYSRARGAASRVFALIDSPNMHDPPSGGHVPRPFVGLLKFRLVNFHYPYSPFVRILNDVNLQIRPGFTTALVGPTGCGKSTIFKLIERFYDVQFGSLDLDDFPLSEVDLEWWRRQVCVIQDDPDLAGESVKDVITYGDPRHNIPLREVVDAATTAGIHDYIMTLPRCYDSLLEEGRHQAFSKEQRLLLDIARAVFRNPRLLLVDDITQSIQPHTSQVLDILKKVIVNRTCVIATSLIREITYADVIAVMSHGHVIEEGTHRELVALKGCYYTLLLQQERDTHHLPSKLRKKEQKQMKRIHDRLVMADSICKHQMDNLRPYAANKSTKIRFDS